MKKITQKLIDDLIDKEISGTLEENWADNFSTEELACLAQKLEENEKQLQEKIKELDKKIKLTEN